MYLDLFLVTTIFLFFFGISNALKGKEFSYVRTPVLVAWYFLFGTTVLYAVFHRYIPELPSDSSIAPAILSLFGLFLGMPILFALVHKWCEPPTDLIDRYGYTDAEFLQMNFSYVVPKIMEIAFQQMVVTILILILSVHLGLEYSAMSLWFIAIFAVAHILLSFFMDIRFVVLYTVGAVFGSLIFPYFVLYVPYGFVYNYIFHWLFYLFTGTAIWAWHTLLVRGNISNAR